MADGISLAGLTKSFGSVKAVRGVDVEIAAGEVVALLGPNGAGKTTTIDMILGLLRPDAGQVSVLGGSPHDAVRAGRVGGMLQTGALIGDLSVREILSMVAALYPNPLTVDAVLTMTGITDIAERRGNKLSGGQTQRVRFAVAAIANPDLLVLDEPTVALDVEARRDFWAAMRRFAGSGKTILFATHYLEEADAYSDRIILMARGRIVADGSSTEIKARVGLKTIRATVPGVDVEVLNKLPGVDSTDRRGDSVVLRSSDSDVALRAFLGSYPAAHDIEVVGAGLEEAFFELTEDHDEDISSVLDDGVAQPEGLR